MTKKDNKQDSESGCFNSSFLRHSERSEESTLNAISAVDSSVTPSSQNDGRIKGRNGSCLPQAGRSLVEMLGTLAIMGVLSIGAIMGFSYAMNKHRTNELLDEARKRAYTIMTQIQLGLTQSLSEYNNHNKFAGGTFSSTLFTGLTGQFGLIIRSVNRPVCQNLLQSGSPIIREVRINEAKNGICTPDNNEVVLVYNRDLSTTDSCQGFHNIKGGCYECTSPYAYAATPQECGRCTNRRMYDNLCGPITCSYGRYHLKDGQCYLCASGGGYFADDDCATYCASIGQPRFIGSDGKCYSCVNTEHVAQSIHVDSEDDCLGPCAGKRIYDSETGMCIKIPTS